MNKLTTAAALAIVALSSVAAFAADEFKIKMDRPFKVGDSVRIATNTSVRQSQKAEIGGQASVQTDEFKATIEGTETIDAVTEKGGEAVKLTIKITKCIKDGADLIPAGSTLTAENVDGKTQFKVDGTEPADDVKQVLGELVDTTKPDGSSTDEVFGTDKPKKVGDTWPGKTDLVAKDINDGPIQLTGDQIKAESKLEDVSVVDGKPIEIIKTTITADVPAKDPNNGANVHDLKIDLKIDATMPVDDATHESTLKMTRAISFKMDSPGPVITITLDGTKEEKVWEIKK
jgi:hypothetical protein